MLRRGASIVGLAVLLSMLFGSASPATAKQATPAATPVPSDDPAAEYCLANGGIVRERYPVWGANSPEAEVRLAGSMRFCEFTGGAGADPSTSWISVSLDTLYAEEPTLAALAYLTTPPLPEIPDNVNPASIYCSHLGGAEIGATTGAGGGWVTDDPAPAIDVMQSCVFPDGSIIDSWGIAYHTDGTIRGADLTSIFRYQSTNPPLVFPGQQ